MGNHAPWLIILGPLWPVISRVSLTLKLAKDHVHHFTTRVSRTRITSRSISLSGQGQQRKTFFSVFYLCINGGSLLSTIITPILRGRYERDIKFMAGHKNCESPWKMKNRVFTMTPNTCLFVQLRNAASTGSRNVTLWPSVSLQRWWWLPWVLYMWFWHNKWFCSYSMRWCRCWQCISSQWCLLLEVGCTTKLSPRETSCWMCVNVLGWVWFTPLTSTHTERCAKHWSSCLNNSVSISLFIPVCT